MKKFKSLFVAFATLLATTMTMAQSGFNYQAVIRDASGNLLADQEIALRITLTTESGNQTYYQEMQTVRSNAYGAVSVVVGEGTVVRGSFSNVPWNSGNVYMKTEFDPTGVGTDDLLVTIGTTKLQSVPVAEYAKKTGEVENPTNIKIQATATTGDEDALFEVKDNDGKVVFAVYKNGVRVYVDENDSKAAKSGFAVAGKSGKDGTESQYFSVNASGTKVYVDDDTVTTNGKAAKAKFAVAGKSGKANANTDYFAVNGYGTQVYVDDENSKAAKAKFAVAGKSGKANGNGNLLVVNQSGTKVYVDDDTVTTNGKAAKAKFAVAGKSGKANANTDYFAVNGYGTQVYVDDTASGKAAKAKFAVAGKSGKADGNLLVVNEAGTKVFVDDEAGNKAAKATFAVAGKSGGKANNTNPNYLTIDNESTRIYIDENNGGKAAKSGFAVAGKSGGKTGSGELFNIDLTQNAEVINDENRVYWYPKKNAFLAGNLQVDSAAQVGTNSFNAGYQNKAIGNYSQALGYMSIASGATSTAIGDQARAGGNNSFAFGKSSLATGEGSVSIGVQSRATGVSSFALGSIVKVNGRTLQPIASGDYSYAIGAGTNASGEGSVAMGLATSATGSNSFAVGRYAYATDESSIAIGNGYYDRKGRQIDSLIANGQKSTAIGYVCKAYGNQSIALGYVTYALNDFSTSLGSFTMARGVGSTAIGYCTQAYSFCETAIGCYNTKYTPGSTTEWRAGRVGYNETNDRLFVIGNGYYIGNSISYSDALIIYKSGDMTVNGKITHSGLVGPSDIRLKKDIQTLNGALDKVLQLRGVSFYWKNKEEMAAAKGKDINNFSYGFGPEKQIGVIAQEIEKVVPELVVTDNDGFKAVKYENLTPLLIEAIKEQNKKIEELEAKLKEMDDLKRMVEELMKKQ